MRLLQKLFGASMLIALCFFPLKGNSVSLSVDCGAWVTRADSRKIQYEAYVIGLLNGMRNVWGSTYFVRENKWEKEPLEKIRSVNQVFMYLDKYCRENPLKDIQWATYVLWDEIAQKK